MGGAVPDPVPPPCPRMISSSRDLVLYHVHPATVVLGVRTDWKGSGEHRVNTMRGRKVLQSQKLLTKVANALSVPSLLLPSHECRQKQPCEDRKHSGDDEDFDESESTGCWSCLV
jgi:hypothetical protein